VVLGLVAAVVLVGVIVLVSRGGEEMPTAPGEGDARSEPETPLLDAPRLGRRWSEIDLRYLLHANLYGTALVTGYACLRAMEGHAHERAQEGYAELAEGKLTAEKLTRAMKSMERSAAVLERMLDDLQVQRMLVRKCEIPLHARLDRLRAKGIDDDLDEVAAKIDAAHARLERLSALGRTARTPGGEEVLAAAKTARKRLDAFFREHRRVLTDSGAPAETLQELRFLEDATAYALDLASSHLVSKLLQQPTPPELRQKAEERYDACLEISTPRIANLEARLCRLLWEVLDEPSDRAVRELFDRLGSAIWRFPGG
jgi:hypothetical protein